MMDDLKERSVKRYGLSTGKKPVMEEVFCMLRRKKVGEREKRKRVANSDCRTRLCHCIEKERKIHEKEKEDASRTFQSRNSLLSLKTK